MSRQKDSFNIIYVGDCEQTSEPGFFTSNSSFKCWIEKSGSEKFLYLSILPESENITRKKILEQIIRRYHPVCNLEIKHDVKPEYKIRQKLPSENISQTSCPCCGSKMKVDQVLENTTVLRCSECGLSDTRLNS